MPNVRPSGDPKQTELAATQTRESNRVQRRFSGLHERAIDRYGPAVRSDLPRTRGSRTNRAWSAPA